MENKLISMTDFVLSLETTEPWAEDYAKSANYAKFLRQPLELWMFVPCDEEGNVLEEPIGWANEECILDDCCTICKCDQYQEAIDRVLFEGFEYYESRIKGIELGLKLFISPNTIDSFYLTKKEEKEYRSWFILDTIEDLVKCNLILTETAIKQIYENN